MTLRLDIVRLHLMTFSDNCQHLTIYLTCFLCTACWAPEVEPPSPKLSPAEIAGLSIASASASSLESNELRHIPSQDKEMRKPEQKSKAQPLKPETSDEDVLSTIEPLVFPYQARLIGDDVPLLGHGGGTILTLSRKQLKGATIEVLEEQNEKVRVLCRGCSTSHPYQAGWISIDYIRPVN